MPAADLPSSLCSLFGGRKLADKHRPKPRSLRLATPEGKGLASSCPLRHHPPASRFGTSSFLLFGQAQPRVMVARGAVFCLTRDGRTPLAFALGSRSVSIGGMRLIVSVSSLFPPHQEQRCGSGSPGDNSPPLAACKGEGESEVGKDDGKGDSQESGGDVRSDSQHTQAGRSALDGGGWGPCPWVTHTASVYMCTHSTPKGSSSHTAKPNTHE